MLLVVLLLEEFCDAEELEIWVLPEDEDDDDRELEELFDVLLDFRCFDDGGSVGCWRDDDDEADAFDASVSFSGDDGASLECSAWLMGL